MIKIQSFTVGKDGFYGHLYCPDKNNFGGKELLVLGGGGMPYKFTTKEAAALLHKSGYESVVAVGISKGAELALAATSHSREINGVIALSPASRVNMGVGPRISWVNLDYCQRV